MLRIFVSSRPGAVRPGVTGVVVHGNGPRILGDEGDEVVPGIPGVRFVRGGSAAAGAAGTAARSGRC
jgi:hypothetical protein